MQADRHADRTVIVTGAASGIGRGIARRFAEEGARVVVADVRRAPKQGEYYETDLTTPTDETIREDGGEATYVETDVSDPEDCESMVDVTVETYGGIDVLVNNAGIHIPGDSQELSLADWERVIGVDLDGAFYCAKFAIPHLVASGGDLLTVASVHESQGGAGPAYASAKAGVVNLTRDLAVELGARGVRVNAICPGFVETPIQDYLDEADIEAARERTLLPRFGTPGDVGDAAVYLASDEARFVHGTTLYVDGGAAAHR